MPREIPAEQVNISLIDGDEKKISSASWRSASSFMKRVLQDWGTSTVTILSVLVKRVCAANRSGVPNAANARYSVHETLLRQIAPFAPLVTTGEGCGNSSGVVFRLPAYRLLPQCGRLGARTAQPRKPDRRTGARQPGNATPQQPAFPLTFGLRRPRLRLKGRGGGAGRRGSAHWGDRPRRLSVSRS